MRFPHQFSWLIDNPLRRLLVSPSELTERLSPRVGGRVLEVGPGSGYCTLELATGLSSTQTLHLVELQPEMLVKVRRRIHARQLSHVTYTCGDATALPFRARTFDAVMAVAVLGETGCVPDSLRELFDVLRPGGRLLVHEHLPDPDLVRFGVLSDFAEAEGFRFLQRWGWWWNYSALFERPARP